MGIINRSISVDPFHSSPPCPSSFISIATLWFSSVLLFNTNEQPSTTYTTNY